MTEILNKYKLTHTSGDGPIVCPFIFSDRGCRNGASCKMSHEKPATSVAVAAVSSSPGGGSPSSSDASSSSSSSSSGSSDASSSSSSVVSTDSSSVISTDSSFVADSATESDGEIAENRAGAYASLEIKGVTASSHPPSASECSNPFFTPAATESHLQFAADEKSKKRKSKKRKSSQDGADGSEAAGVDTRDLGKADGQSPPKKIKGADVINYSVAAPPNKKPKGQKTEGAAADDAAAASPPREQPKRQPQPVAAPQPPPKSNVALLTKADAKPSPSGVVSFRDLKLPIASFSLPIPDASASKPPSPRPPSPQHEPSPPPPPLPLPIATPAHLKWKDAVVATRANPKYANSFNYDHAKQSEFEQGLSTPEDWIVSRPHGDWCAGYPAAIAIDCEMCGTKDPVTGAVDPKALCRVSIVNADNPEEVLLDTLVKPTWPVVDHRTFVNGIAKKDLVGVEFTLKHAQMFMSALCSDQTVVVGHAVHNDLLALRMVHHCNADTAMLFQCATGEASTPSLKNLAFSVFKKDMPDVHCSVNDARVALTCAEHWVKNNGKVEPVEKVFTRSRSRSFSRSPHRSNVFKKNRPHKYKKNGKNSSAVSGSSSKKSRSAKGPSSKKSNSVRKPPPETNLLVHRLPTNAQPGHISDMFLAYTCVRPNQVSKIDLVGGKGKCYVEFASVKDAQKAYSALAGKEREDTKGAKQKRVETKDGGYVCVRKMY